MFFIKKVSEWNQIYSRMEVKISIEKRNNRTRLCGLQRKVWIKVYKIKRVKDKST